MALTTYAPALTAQAGYFKLLLGPKITNLAAPSLAAFTLDLSCAVHQFGFDMDVSMKTRQDMCKKVGHEEVDQRVKKLTQMIVRANATQAELLAAFALDAEVGFFLRPYIDSDTAVAAADKGWTANARVSKLVPNGIQVGNDYEWIAEFYRVDWELNATLAA